MLDTISFALAGDLCLGSEYVSMSLKGESDLLSPFLQVRREFEDADIFVANLEGPVFQGETTRPEGAPVLSNHESSLQLFMGASIGVLKLANNHVMDFGEEGLRRTLSLRLNMD